MKKVYILFVFAFLMGTVSFTVAQRIVQVEPGIGTLNDAINGDTLEDGSRVDLNTVYELQRGEQALYSLTGSIENRFPLTIVAEDGDGPRPFLQPRIAEGGGSSRAFRARGDITLKGLHFTNRDNDGGLNTRMLRCSADSIKIVVDDCWMDEDAQSGLRLDNPNMRIYITNTVISNIGSPAAPNNGRGVDDRGNNVDTLVFENCTFYNITSRIVRDGGGWIKYARFNNNTVVNVGQHGIWFGEVGTLEAKNNIFVNQPFLPTDDEGREGTIVIDSIGTELMDMGITQSVDISYNNFVLDTSLIESYLNDTLLLAPLFDSVTQAFIDEAGTANTFYFEPVEFIDGPADPTEFISYQLNPDLDPDDAPFWEIPEVPEGDFYHLDVPYDFGYSHDVLATASATGGPLGDPNWEVTDPVGIFDKAIAGALDKIKVYPNPVNNFARFDYSVENRGFVSIEIFDIVGKKVTSLVNEEKPAGEYTVNWNVTSQTGMPVSSGIYFLKLNVNNQSYTQKMIIK